MLGHLSLGVRDLVKAAAFYDATLGVLGYARLWTGEQGLGYGPPDGGEKLNLFQHPDARAPGPGFHLAFTACKPSDVDRFHAAALAMGGSDLGPPGPRPHYGASYYAAFVADPEGHKLEAVYQ